MFRRKKIGQPYIVTIQNIELEITRKQIKTIRLKVNPSTKKVKVSCPYRVSEKELLNFITSNLNWIKKHLAKKVASDSIHDEREYNDGDLLPFKGEKLVLKINNNAPKTSVKIQGNNIVLSSKHILTRDKREKAVFEFYRSYLKTEIPKLIKKWEPIMGVSVAEFGVKKMKTRWGTCNINSRRIWLSLALAEKNIELLEYVVVHEMVHLHERLHNQRFKNFMTLYLPNWKVLQKQLNGRID